MSGPLTLGTAGHVDHGKTALVRALTGVDTDRLPEERARGLSIVLGYAPLKLPSGRQLSVVDVPGHERFVRTMVAGASGIDAFLLVIAADDGVMPQTREHATVLRALGIEHGLIAVTKADIAPPQRACEEASELLAGTKAIACSARTGAGLHELLTALEELAGRIESRAGDSDAPVRLHIDRAFTISGRGTVVTGTLWSGAIAAGASLQLAHAGRRRQTVRVRGLQIHDEQVTLAEAGQRVAVNLIGVRAAEVARGDALLDSGHARETKILDCALTLDGARHGERVQVHHGTRDVPGRLCQLGDDLWQLRLERPLLALDGDRLVVRRLAPPDTLGGGRVLDAAARRHGASGSVREIRAAALATRASPAPATPARPAPATRASPALDERALADLEARLLAAGAALLSEAQLSSERAALQELRRRGRAVRVSGRLYAHAQVLAQAREQIVALLAREGAMSLRGVRNALGLSRKSTQAFLEHLDATRITRRLPDDARVLSRPYATTAPER